MYIVFPADCTNNSHALIYTVKCSRLCAVTYRQLETQPYRKQDKSTNQDSGTFPSANQDQGTFLSWANQEPGWAALYSANLCSAAS